MGLPWYRVHTSVINDPGRLLAVHLMHNALCAGFAGSMLLFELALYDPSDPVLNPMWRQGCFFDALRGPPGSNQLPWGGGGGGGGGGAGLEHHRRNLYRPWLLDLLKPWP